MEEYLRILGRNPMHRELCHHMKSLNISLEYIIENKTEFLIFGTLAKLQHKNLGEMLFHHFDKNKHDLDMTVFLGYMYDEGFGVEKDMQKAVELYEKAADKKHAYGQNNLGYAYANGEGVEKDMKKGYELFKKSANQGNMSGQNSLGYAYAHGEGVEKDIKEAIKWYKRAADRGYASAQNNLACVYENGDSGIKPGIKEAIKWYERSAVQGNSAALNNLGYAYAHGEGVEKDMKKAIKLYKKAAAQRNLTAQRNLNDIFKTMPICRENYVDLYTYSDNVNVREKEILKALLASEYKHCLRQFVDVVEIMIGYLL